MELRCGSHHNHIEGWDLGYKPVQLFCCYFSFEQQQAAKEMSLGKADLSEHLSVHHARGVPFSLLDGIVRTQLDSECRKWMMLCRIHRDKTRE